MNNIFGFFIQRQTDGEKDAARRVAYAEWFVTNFPGEEFEGDERVMYHMVEFASKLQITVKEKYLGVFLDTKLKPIIVKEKVHVVGTEQLSYEDVAQTETAVQVTKGVVTGEYYRLLNEDCETDDFVLAADAWMSKQLNDRLIKLYSSGFEMISNLKGKMIGSSDALEYTEMEVAKIRELYDVEKLEELATSHTSANKVFEFVLDTGLGPIDEDLKGLFTSQMIGIEAPAGTGKTLFACGVCAYRAAVVYHKNVLYYTLEQKTVEIEAILTARHIFTLFNKIVNFDLILKNLVPPELKETVAIAKADLFESGKYGKITIEEKDLYVESFIGKIKMADKLTGPYDVIVIDYMTLIEQKGGQYQKMMQPYEVTKKAYKWFKRYVRNNDKLGIAVNQLTGDESKAAEQDKELSVTGAAGGQEARRSADTTLVISATKAMKSQNKRRISQPKSRSSDGFDSCLIDVRLGFAYWFINKAETVL